MTNTKTKLTYESYLKTPDDERYELLDGELLVMEPAPLTAHQYVLGNLYYAMRLFSDERNLGEVYISPTDVVLSDTDVVQPDLLFVSYERAHIVTRENIQGAPDLIVEILSPSTAERDRTLKLDLYARHGVKEYWLVDPNTKTVMVLLLSEHRFEAVGTYGEGQTLDSPTLAGFSLNLAGQFRRG